MVCELSGQTRAELDTGNGWLRQAELDETITIGAAEDAVRYQGTLRGRVALREVSSGEDRQQAPQEPLAPASGALEDLTGPEREALARIIGGATLESLIDATAAAVASGDRSQAASDTWLKLCCLLELQPELASRVHELVATRAVADGVAQALVAALGAAGHAEGQAILAAVYGDAQLSDDVRTASAVAIAQLQRPTAALLEAVLGSLQDQPGIDGLSTTGMLAFGAAASRKCPLLADGRTPTQALLALESKAAASGSLEAWLEALGNADPEQAAPRVLESLKDARESVRRSAASALRDARDEQALAALDRVAHNDASPWVRQMAVSSLAARAAAADTLRKIAREDSHEGVRREAIVALGRRSDSDTKHCLQDIAAGDPSEDLRKLAARVLNG